MIPLAFSRIELSADTEVKQTMALRQMNELVERLSNTPKYHTLTKKDRSQLNQEGYAADLVDNLLVMTQRTEESSATDNDLVVVGFTYAAFDPALYASETLKNHFEQLSQGCCCFCESFLMPTASGHISHYRPVQLLDLADVEHVSPHPHHECSPYFSLAYQQENLVYACSACDVTHKAGTFTVAGQRYPEVALEEEKAVLVNPYQDNPRDFIRFNPSNAHAYAFDQVLAFYSDTKKLSKQDIEALLWRSPSAIPNQVDEAGVLLTESAVEQAFHAWLTSTASKREMSRGQMTIATLGLNRTVLVLARLAMLKQYQNDFLNQQGASPIPLIAKDLVTTAYRSLGVDAFATWQHLRHSEVHVESTYSNKAASTQQRKLVTAADKALFETPLPTWLRSCISYLVTESELQLTDRRRLVYLSSQDRLYGETDTEKCIFLPINWQRDLHRVIKVRSQRNIWEASFSELANSRPHELINLFANNDVWVEGSFTTLA
ncbi:hypothetical protein L2755_19740 [Shewanella abyssi]|uniref:hypothetical protein n=1 Tax=Shewanella abyssi TaxID=311789 RepID=UPI00201012D6|nr:hypothetical protein [Shewanella abyssi]MCL1051839.1 hypothetical protein [Shewanella abyssi]